MYIEFERVVSALVVGRGPPHCKSRHYLSVSTSLPRLVSFTKRFYVYPRRVWVRLFTDCTVFVVCLWVSLLTRLSLL